MEAHRVWPTGMAVTAAVGRATVETELSYNNTYISINTENGDFMHIVGIS